MLYRKLFMTNFNIIFLAEKKRATKTNESNSQGMIIVCIRGVSIRKSDGLVRQTDYCMFL